MRCGRAGTRRPRHWSHMCTGRRDAQPLPQQNRAPAPRCPSRRAMLNMQLMAYKYDSSHPKSLYSTPNPTVCSLPPVLPAASEIATACAARASPTRTESPPLSGVSLRRMPPLSGMPPRRALSCPEHAEHRQHGIPAGRASKSATKCHTQYSRNKKDQLSRKICYPNACPSQARHHNLGIPK